MIFITNFLEGIKDSLGFPMAVFIIYSSTTLSKLAVRTITINLTILAILCATQYYTSYGVHLFPLISLLANHSSNQRIATRACEIYKIETKKKSAVKGVLVFAYIFLLLCIMFSIGSLTTFLIAVNGYLEAVPFTIMHTIFIWMLCLYKWAAKGWTIDQSILYFETNLSYLFGFGNYN
jgi:hypothetical protein